MKKKTAMICCVVLAITLLIGMLPHSASADSGVVSGAFTYMPSFVDDPANETYFYSDGYFDKASSVKNEHLISMSMALALATMEIKGSSYITALFDDIGYTDVRVDDMDVAPTRDTIGSAIAHRNVGGSDVVAVAIRGNKYGAEWASNLTAGDSGNIKGFEDAADKVLDRLRSYISDHKLTDVKLWIAGYSRAGSAADLMGVYINEHLNEFGTSADGLYVYCFEAPRCCSSSKTYSNIYCIRNKNDLITYVYPEAWGLYTNGVEIVVGEEMTVDKVKIDVLDSPMDTVLGEVALDEFAGEFVDFLADEITREEFSGEFGDAVAELIELYFSKSSGEWQKFADFASDSDLLAKAKDNDRFMYVMMYEVSGGIRLHNSDKMYRQLADELLLALDELVTAEELGLTDAEYQIIRDDMYPLIRVLGPLAVKDYMYREGIDYSAAMPEGYDDPDFDPQTAEDPILTYDQYTEMQAHRDEEPDDDEPEESESDADKAWSDVYSSDCYDIGYEDGIAGRDPITEAPLPENADERSQEYLESYAKVYLDCYLSGYANGVDARDPKSEVYYDGSYEGDTAALADARKDALSGSYKASYSEVPAPKDDGSVYPEDYLAGYRFGYSAAYDNYYEVSVEDFKHLSLYHLGTFAMQLNKILTQHYPQTNWELVKALDTYYTQGVPEGTQPAASSEAAAQPAATGPQSATDPDSSKSASGSVKTGELPLIAFTAAAILSLSCVLIVYFKKKEHKS